MKMTSEQFLDECVKALKSLEWCHQWLQGDDAKKVGKDIRAFKAALRKMRWSRLPDLLSASDRVWTTFLEYGPVDDGRPEGDEFDAALMNLRFVSNAAKSRDK